MNPFYIISYNFLKIRFNIQSQLHLGLPICLCLSGFPHQNSVNFSLVPQKCHTPRLLNSPFGYYSCSLKDKAVRAYAIKKCGGLEVWLYSFLSSTLDWGEWPASRAGRFTTTKESPYPLSRMLRNSLVSPEQLISQHYPCLLGVTGHFGHS
jgi:hypothetical protein